MTATATLARHRLRHLGYACTLLPVLRWLIATHTVPAGQPWRTRCAGCGTALWPTTCTPTGRCHTCQARIGPPPYTVEAAVLVAFGLLVWSGARGWELAAHTYWTAGVLALAFIDATVLRLPHRVTLATAAGTIPLLVAAGGPGSSWWHATIGAAALVGFYVLIHLVSRGGLGLGDITVAVPIGIALGWLDWHLIITAALLAHVLAAATIPIRRLVSNTRAPLPLGPYLIGASFVVIVTSGVL